MFIVGVVILLLLITSLYVVIANGKITLLLEGGEDPENDVVGVDLMIELVLVDVVMCFLK